LPLQIYNLFVFSQQPGTIFPDVYDTSHSKINMKKSNLLSLILLSSALICSKCTKKEEYDLFSFDESKFKKHYTGGESAELHISNPKDKEIDSIVYFSNDEKLGSVKGHTPFTLPLDGNRLGYQNLKAVIYYEGETTPQETMSRVEVVSSIQPKLLTATVVNVFPHDPEMFTQGFEFYRDTLIESSGQRGRSKVIKLDYKTGKVYQSAELEPQYFGEGSTVIDGKLFMLTWQEKTGFIYNADTWKLEKTFKYDKDIEGWGMTNDGSYIYLSDGTEKIWKMDPKTQKLIDHINVYMASAKIKQVNELEYVDGKIYGNVWQKDAIAVIDVKNH
jgi:glutamine cyclotransferase